MDRFTYVREERPRPLEDIFRVFTIYDRTVSMDIPIARVRTTDYRYLERMLEGLNAVQTHND